MSPDCIFASFISHTCPQEGKGDDFRLGLFTERRQSGTVRAGDQCAEPAVIIIQVPCCMRIDIALSPTIMEVENGSLQD